MSDKSQLYFECHITTDPIFGERREALEKIVKPFKFSLAKLFMKKGENEESEHKEDTFMTGRHIYYSVLQSRMEGCIKAAKDAGFVVRRYKIENTIIDSKKEDLLDLLA